MRLTFGALLVVVLAGSSLAESGRSPQSLRCLEQLAVLTKQYSQGCSRFGRPPACERCPAGSASCASKCSECKIISDQIDRKTEECGR
jgi:hypothetical protein